MTTPTSAPRQKRPILILGPPRSGTSLLSRMLNAHPNIAVPFESHLFNQWLPRLKRYPDLQKPETQRRLVADIARYGVVHDWTPTPTPGDILPRIQTPDLGGVGRAILEWWAEQQSASRWGEKTPHHLLMHKAVRAAWPDALVVFMLRDPRDAILSWRRARFGPRHAIPLAEAWSRYANAMLDCKAAAPAQDQHEIRYESVVTEPEQTIRSLMDFLGEPFDPQQLAFYSGQHSRWHTDKRNAERLAAPVKSDAVGRWKAGLTPKDVRRIEAIAGEPMRALGYPPTTDSPTIRSAEAAIAKTITHPCSRLIGILHNREGFGYAARDLAWRLGRG